MSAPRSQQSEYWVYITASITRVIYVGVTNDLTRRIADHKSKRFPGFTARYNVTRLVHCERFGDARDAVARERELKGWRRAKKVALIEAANPDWIDLSDEAIRDRGA